MKPAPKKPAPKKPARKAVAKSSAKKGPRASDLPHGAVWVDGHLIRDGVGLFAQSRGKRDGRWRVVARPGPKAPHLTHYFVEIGEPGFLGYTQVGGLNRGEFVIGRFNVMCWSSELQAEAVAAATNLAGLCGALIEGESD